MLDVLGDNKVKTVLAQVTLPNESMERAREKVQKAVDDAGKFTP